MIPAPRIVLLLIIATALSGCGLTSTVETSRQLNDGDRVVSTTLGWPGYYIILPRINVLGMYGIGDAGDFGVHAGLNRTSVNIGATGRGYVTDHLIAGVTADVERLGDGADVRGVPIDAGGLATITPRVVTTTDDERRWYSGVQSDLMFRVAPDSQASAGPFAQSVGVIGGFEHLFTRRGIQIEAIVSLIRFDDAVHDDGLVPSLQLNLGGYLYSPS